LPMYYNQIQAGQMGKTVSWLPTRSEDNRGTLYVLAGEHPESGRVDGNVMTASQVAQANAKYWDVYRWNWNLDDWEPYTGNTFLLGDVDGNGSISIADVTALIDYILNGDASAISMEASDVDATGSVNIADVTALIDYLVGGQLEMRKSSVHPRSLAPRADCKDDHIFLDELEAIPNRQQDK